MMDHERWRSFLGFVDQRGGATHGCCPSVLKQLIERLPRALDGRNKALVVGAGGGTAEKALLESLGYEVSQVDLIPQNDTIIAGDMHDLPFHKNFFNVVVYNQSFEHALSPFIALFEANRVLETGGLAAIAWPDTCERWTKDPQHYSVLTRMQMEALLNRTSFVITDYELVSEDGTDSTEQQMQIVLACKLNDVFRMMRQ